MWDTEPTINQYTVILICSGSVKQEYLIRFARVGGYWFVVRGKEAWALR